MPRSLRPKSIAFAKAALPGRAIPAAGVRLSRANFSATTTPAKPTAIAGHTGAGTRSPSTSGAKAAT